MRSIFTAILLGSFSVTSLAHEYWLEPESERTPVRLFVGEGLKGEGLKKEEERPFQSSKTPLLRLLQARQNLI